MSERLPKSHSTPEECPSGVPAYSVFQEVCALLALYQLQDFSSYRPRRAGIYSDPGVIKAIERRLTDVVSLAGGAMNVG